MAELWMAELWITCLLLGGDIQGSR